MAFRLRHWAMGLVFGMTLLALRLHPALQPTQGEERPIRAERARFLELRSQVAAERDVLSRLRWLDSLTQLLEPARRTGPPVSVGITAVYPDDLAKEIEARVRSHVAAMTRVDPSVDVGLFALTLEGGPSVPRRELYVGERLGRPYCLVMELSSDRTRPPRAGIDAEGSGAAGRSPPELGPCVFFLRYGRPGPEIARWLEAGAIGRGAAVTVPTAYLLADRRSRLLGGLDHEPSFQVRPRGVRCLEGDPEACREGFLAGQTAQLLWTQRLDAAVPELWDIEGFAWGFDFELADPALLVELERAFGEERFLRFWTSRERPDVAFHGAFGVEAGAWMGEWARSHHGAGRTRLRAGAGGWTLSLMLVLGALSLAVASARRRQVG